MNKIEMPNQGRIEGRMTGITRAVGKAVGFARAVAESFSWALQRRALYEELSRMSDRQLRDIGLSRSDIPAIVAGVYARDARNEEPEAASAMAGQRRRAGASPRNSEEDLAA